MDTNPPQDEPSNTIARNDNLVDRKQLLEVEALERDGKLWHIILHSKLLVVAVGGAAGLSTMWMWSQDGKAVRDERKQAQVQQQHNQRHSELNATFRRSEDTNFQVRITAISSLGKFSNWPEEHHDKILQHLADTLASENNGQIQETIVSYFQNITKYQISDTVKHHALATLILHSRAIVSNFDLYERPIETAKVWRGPSVAPSGRTELDNAWRRSMAIGKSIAALLRAGTTTASLVGVDLSRTDLSGLDLAGISFDRSILSMVKFDKAVLNDASFRGADIRGASFRSSELHNANFGHEYGAGLVRYFRMKRTWSDKRVLRTLPDNEWVWVDGPDFSCADLTGATFHDFNVLGLESRALGRIKFPGYIDSSSFVCANLESANFTASRLYGFVVPADRFKNSDSCWGLADSIGPSQGISVGLSHSCAIDWDVFDTDNIGGLFVGANWKDAILPHTLEVLLENTEIPTGNNAIKWHCGCKDND